MPDKPTPMPRPKPGPGPMPKPKPGIKVGIMPLPKPKESKPMFDGMVKKRGANQEALKNAIEKARSSKQGSKDSGFMKKPGEKTVISGKDSGFMKTPIKKIGKY